MTPHDHDRRRSRALSRPLRPSEPASDSNTPDDRTHRRRRTNPTTNLSAQAGEAHRPSPRGEKWTVVDKRSRLASNGSLSNQ